MKTAKTQKLLTLKKNLLGFEKGTSKTLVEWIGIFTIVNIEFMTEYFIHTTVDIKKSK